MLSCVCSSRGWSRVVWTRCLGSRVQVPKLREENRISCVPFLSTCVCPLENLACPSLLGAVAICGSEASHELEASSFWLDLTVTHNWAGLHSQDSRHGLSVGRRPVKTFPCFIRGLQGQLAQDQPPFSSSARYCNPTPQQNFLLTHLT